MLDVEEKVGDIGRRKGGGEENNGVEGADEHVVHVGHVCGEVVEDVGLGSRGLV